MVEDKCMEGEGCHEGQVMITRAEIIDDFVGDMMRDVGAVHQ